MMLSSLWQNLNLICVFVLRLFLDMIKINKSMGWKSAHRVNAGIWYQDDVVCGPIFSMNTTMGVKITCEMLTNSPVVPLLPMQQISTLWIFATPHTCAHSRRPWSSLQSTNLAGDTLVWKEIKHSHKFLYLKWLYLEIDRNDCRLNLVATACIFRPRE